MDTTLLKEKENRRVNQVGSGHLSLQTDAEVEKSIIQVQGMLTKKILAMSCPEFGSFENGIIQSKNKHVNDTATFKCNKGYNLVGDETLTCQVIDDAASWSNKPPTCKRKGLIFSQFTRYGLHFCS